MPVKRCGQCGEMHELPKDVYRYIHPREEYVCSRNCVLDWVRDHEAPKNFDWRWKYPYPGFVTDGIHALYSQTLRRWFGSKYEIQVALWLAGHDVEWIYEDIGFPMGRQRYTPDFFLPAHDVFLEVKGAWVTGKKKKMDQFRIDYPSVDLLVVPWLLVAEFDPLLKEELICHSVR